MLAYYSKQLLFTQMTAKISGMERPTTPYGASSVHLKIKINDVVDVYQYEESETFIDWLCLPKYKTTPFRNTMSEKVDMYQPISF